MDLELGPASSEDEVSRMLQAEVEAAMAMLAGTRSGASGSAPPTPRDQQMGNADWAMMANMFEPAAAAAVSPAGGRPASAQGNATVSTPSSVRSDRAIQPERESFTGEMELLLASLQPEPEPEPGPAAAAPAPAPEQQPAAQPRPIAPQGVSEGIPGEAALVQGVAQLPQEAMSIALRLFNIAGEEGQADAAQIASARVAGAHPTSVPAADAPQRDDVEDEPAAAVDDEEEAEPPAGIPAELAAAMELHGLTREDQAVLLEGGVTTLEILDMLEDEDFTLSGVDIGARRAAKALADAAVNEERAAEKKAAVRREADAAGVRELLQCKEKGRQISYAGQATILEGVGGAMDQLCSLDLKAMRVGLGLSIMDARLLSNVLGKADVVARYMVPLSWARAHVDLEIYAALDASGSPPTRPKKRKEICCCVRHLGTGRDQADRWRTAICGEVLHADGSAAAAAYAEFTMVAGSGTTMFGIVRASHDPTDDRSSQRSRESWMFNCKSGKCLRPGSSRGQPLLPPTQSGVVPGDRVAMGAAAFGGAGKVALGQTVGLLLRNGSLTVFQNGEAVGAMCEGGLKGNFEWAADMYDTGAAARIVRRPPPR